tara:strand:+ start:498 stop:1070 length:573 start_codon:yes stop_codon:yes gene_type:complete
MENINLIDALSLTILFISAILAYFRGLSREILAIVSWILAALLAFVFAPHLDPLINEIPVIEEILTDSCQLSILISFVISFIFSLIFLSLIIPMITQVVHQSSLNSLDRLLGLLFGALRGLVIIIALTIGYDLLFNDSETPNIVANSKTIEMIFDIKEDFKTNLPNTKPDWIMNRFDILMIKCETSSEIF